MKFFPVQVLQVSPMQKEVMRDEQVFQSQAQNVAAVVTAMTDKEAQFLYRTIEAILADAVIGQVLLCIEEHNTWITPTLGQLITDPRLEIIRMPLAIVGAVRNRALERVRLPWVAYCDGDDIWCKDKTAIQRRLAEATGSDFVGADNFLINEQGKVCGFAFSRNIPMPSSWLVRTEVMRKYPFNESMPISEDGEWWDRTNANIKKMRCARMLLHYRIRANSASSTTPSMRRKAKIVAIASYPILREIMFCLTGFVWLFTRQQRYVWLKDWDKL